MLLSESSEVRETLFLGKRPFQPELRSGVEPTPAPLPGGELPNQGLSIRLPSSEGLGVGWFI